MRARRLSEYKGVYTEARYAKNSIAPDSDTIVVNTISLASFDATKTYDKEYFDSLLVAKSQLNINNFNTDSQKAAIQSIISAAKVICIYNNISKELLESMLPFLKNKKIIILYDNTFRHISTFQKIKADNNNIIFRKVRKENHSDSKFVYTDTKSCIQESTIHFTLSCEDVTDIYLFNPILSSKLEKTFQRNIINSIFLPFLK